MNAGKFSSRPRGFTLIEILISTAIAAVLLALLVTVGGRTVDRSREARCVGNLRQLHMGFTLYAQDHGGRLPFGPRDPDVTEPLANYYGGVYAAELKPYIPSRPVPGANTGYVEPYLCPADRESRAGSIGFLGHSYGVNQTICDERWSRPLNWKNASRTFLLADSKKAVISRSSPATNLGPRHRGGANTLFCDGHVEWRTAPFPNASQDRTFWYPSDE